MKEGFFGCNDDTDEKIDGKTDDEQPVTTDIPDLESEESAEQGTKKGKELKILRQNQMFSRLPISLPQLKAGNNSKKTWKWNKATIVSIYYTEKNIKSAYSNNKFKISAPAWNDEVNLPDGSYSISEIKYYFEYIIKKHETITDNLPVQNHTNKIKKGLFLK